jgi:hypothetical protein
MFVNCTRRQNWLLRNVSKILFLKNIDAVSIFKYIDVMLLNLDPDIVRFGPRLHSTCSKQHGGSTNSSADEKKIS